MLKTLKDFPQLASDKYLSSLCLDHFKNGLDPSIIIDKDSGFEMKYTLIEVENEENLVHYLETPILYKLLNKSMNYKTTNEEKELIYSFFKQEVLKLKDNKKYTSKNLNELALLIINERYPASIVDFFFANNIADINYVTPDGRSFLMRAKDSAVINTLMKYKPNIEYKVDNPKSQHHGLNVYEMALKSKKKGWISYLKPYMSDVVIDKNNNAQLDSFKAEKNYKKQVKIFILSLKENNHQVIDYISANQEKYSDMISHIDGHEKTILHQCISVNNKEILEKVMLLDYYKKEKNDKSKNYGSYALYAVEQNKLGPAKILIENGYKDNKKILDYLKDSYYSYPTILPLLIEEKEDIPLILRFDHACTYKLDEYLSKTTTIKINQFLVQIGNYLKLSPLQFYNDNKLQKLDIKGTFFSGSLIEVKSSHIKFICQVFKEIKKHSEDSYTTYFDSFLKNIDPSDEDITNYVALNILSVLPEEKNKVLSIFSNKEWAIKLLKQDLNKVLEKFNEKEIKKFKI